MKIMNAGRFGLWARRTTCGIFRMSFRRGRDGFPAQIELWIPRFVIGAHFL